MLEHAGLVGSQKDGLWVNYYLSAGETSPYAATIIGNLRHWLDEDPEVAELIGKIPFLNREELCGKKSKIAEFEYKSTGGIISELNEKQAK